MKPLIAKKKGFNKPSPVGEGGPLAVDEAWRAVGFLDTNLSMHTPHPILYSHPIEGCVSINSIELKIFCSTFL